MSTETATTTIARYLITFDRLGRTHDVPPLNTEAYNTDDLGDRILSYARPYLGSRDIDIYLGSRDIDIYTSPDGRRGFILCGLRNGGTFTIVDREPWHHRCDQPRSAFQRGTRIQHRNPKYADWRGIVEPETTGRHRGKCIRLSVPFDGDPWVHIRWTGGSYAEHGPAVGWYDVTAIAADGAR
jgi:hypothetical protein